MDREYRNRLVGLIRGRGSGAPFANGADDWRRFYEYIADMQRADTARRPSWQDVEDVLAEALPNHPDWRRELITAYVRGVDLLDYVGSRG